MYIMCGSLSQINHLNLTHSLGLSTLSPWPGNHFFCFSVLELIIWRVTAEPNKMTNWLTTGSRSRPYMGTVNPNSFLDYFFGLGLVARRYVMGFFVMDKFGF